MITTSHPRSAARLTLVLLALAGACTHPMPSPSPSHDPAPNAEGQPRHPPAMPTPMVQAAWRFRIREHVDLWLHSYALLTADSTLVPYFRRGYRDRLLSLRRQRNVTTLLDGSNRATLLARFDANPSLATSGQFLPLYFESWEQMRQIIELFQRANGNPGATTDPTARTYMAILAGIFPTAPDREWLRQFAAAVDDESRKFYHDYWTSEARGHASVVAHTDSLWQRQWRPSLQRFLNNTQQQNGEVYLSFPLGGEGRTIHYGKQQNAIAVPVPDVFDQSEVVLYVFAHEAAGTIASTAIEDNTTPADRRSGTTSRYEQSAAVRGGALLLERTLPGAVPGYMRYYLQQAGRVPPSDPRASFASTFAVPDAVRDAIARQLDVIMGGI